MSPQNSSTLDVLILVMAPKGSESAKFWHFEEFKITKEISSFLLKDFKNNFWKFDSC